ncbi:MAG: hypothetical protein KAS04_00255 [Candidatus Aenigmarchaeota archaeon]|nr:hypothetical protein [Candidatus Aenigmarchaeota archaeon]
MIDFIAYVYLLGAVILWGSYIVPFKKMKADVPYSQFLMCSGIMLVTIILSFVFNLGFTITVFGIASGAMWAVGNFLSLLAIKKIGISRAYPIWISSMLVAYFWGVLLFSEITGIGIMMGLLGTLAVLAGAVLITKTEKTKGPALITGILLAIGTALFFGTQFVPFKLSGFPAWEYYFQMSVGIFITSLVIFLLNRKVPRELQLKNGLLGGIIWGIANLLGIYVVQFFGIAKSGPLTQLSVVIGVLWGLFYFKEISGRKAVVRILAGTIVILIGAIIVSLA